MAKTLHFKLDKTITRADDRVIKMVFDLEVNTWDFFYTAKKYSSADDSEAVITVDPAEVIFTESSPDYTNIVEIPLSHLVTDIEPGRYFHDVQTKKEDGVINTIAKGILTVQAQNTQRTS